MFFIWLYDCTNTHHLRVRERERERLRKQISEMASYAAVVSLKQTIERLMIPSLSSILVPNSEMELLLQDLHHLQSFLQEITPLQRKKKVDTLERLIKDVVQNVEDLIDFHVLDRLLSVSDESLNLEVFSQRLLRAKQEIGSLIITASKIEEEECSTQDEKPSITCFAAVSSRTCCGADNSMVGLGDQLKKLKDWLLRGPYRLDIISVVGMVGIGKTTLVQKAYHDSTVVYLFPCCVFVTIDVEYELRDILLLVLHQMGFDIDGMHREEDEELGTRLYRFLKGRRYLIVLDDIRSTLFWSELKRFFPNDNTGSRIVLTTRLLDFTHRAGIKRNTLQIPFLNEDESWALLQRIVFTSKEMCSSQLKKIGKKIAEICEGLPLAIIAVGNHLRRAERTVENWEKLSEDENSLIVSSDDYASIMKTLASSYKELPQHLKGCFLYMGVFPKDYKITPSKLINLWACEGLIEPRGGRSLEETANEFLDDLVSRSVVLAGERSSRGRTNKTCRLHFVFRNLCISEAQNEELFHIINKYANIVSDDTNNYSQRRLCIHNNVVLGFQEVYQWMESVLGAHSVLCFGPSQPYPIGLCLRFRLLKILDALRIRFYEFPHQVLQLVHLRYLAVTCDGDLPPSISCLRNIEVLIVNRHQRITTPNVPAYLPMEIWNLHELLHLQCNGFDLPDPSSIEDSLVLNKLLTVSGVSAHSCTRGVLGRMPKLMKLGIQTSLAHSDRVETFSLGEFSSLCEEFESFKCVIVNPSLEPHVAFSIPCFSSNVRKITLSGCGFPWEYVRVIAELPKLEVLKLRCYAFRGREWEVSEDGFVGLKFLLLEDLDIQLWVANYEHFPSLQRLIIRHCYNLREIPRGMGHIPTLETIEVEDCSSSAMVSARQIHDEQRSLGTDDLQFRIHSSLSDKKISVF